MKTVGCQPLRDCAGTGSSQEEVRQKRIIRGWLGVNLGQAVLVWLSSTLTTTVLAYLIFL